MTTSQSPIDPRFTPLLKFMVEGNTPLLHDWPFITIINAMKNVFEHHPDVTDIEKLAQLTLFWVIEP